MSKRIIILLLLLVCPSHHVASFSVGIQSLTALNDNHEFNSNKGEVTTLLHNRRSFEQKSFQVTEKPLKHHTRRRAIIRLASSTTLLLLLPLPPPLVGYDPNLALAATPLTVVEADDFNARLNRALRPAPTKSLLRPHLNLDFAVLLMRSSYNAMDQLNCVAMVRMLLQSLKQNMIL